MVGPENDIPTFNFMNDISTSPFYQFIYLYKNNIFLYKYRFLMSKMSYSCEDHSQAVFVSSFDGFLVTN